MAQIQEMTPPEMHALLHETSFGHLGCAREGRPYVVPMHYAYDGQDIYFLTTEGTKTAYIEANSLVCFQVEIVDDAAHWRSVMVTGQAARLSKPEETEQATQLITGRNASLTPALTPMQGAGSLAIYRLRPESVSGRKSE